MWFSRANQNLKKLHYFLFWVRINVNEPFLVLHYMIVIDCINFCTICRCCVRSKQEKTLIVFAIFCLFFVHNILPQTKEGDLSPHFNEEMFIGILFIDRPISIDMFVLVKKLSTGLIWDPICWEARALRPYRHSQLFWCAPQASIWLCLLKSAALLHYFSHLKNLQKKMKKKCPGELF